MDIVRKRKSNIINSVIKKHMSTQKREISQLSIKIDKNLDNALNILSSAMNISKNRLIEDILSESGIIEEAKKDIYCK